MSVVSLIGAFMFTLRTDFLRRIMLFLVSFSTGAILGSVFLHLIPESMEHADDPLTVSVFMLAGMAMAFAIEKFIHWHHCHATEHDEPEGHHVHPVGPLILVGDGLHNAIDGMLIAGAFMVGVPVGIATSIAVVLHEIPQEMSDVALLIHSGFSRTSAIVWNLISACTAFIGAGVALAFGAWVEGIQFMLLPIAAGNFLYIAAADLIPELHRETRMSRTIVQSLLLLVGLALMAGIVLGRGHEVFPHDGGDRPIDSVAE